MQNKLTTKLEGKELNNTHGEYQKKMNGITHILVLLILHTRNKYSNK